MRLGNRLKHCRFDHNDMSQEALARAIGVTRQTIISIEKGRYVPSTLLALKLARFLGRQLDEIFYIVENQTEDPLGE